MEFLWAHQTWFRQLTTCKAMQRKGSRKKDYFANSMMQLTPCFTILGADKPEPDCNLAVHTSIAHTKH